MASDLVFLGFGEAGQAFAGDPSWRARAGAFDVKTADPRTREAQLRAYSAHGVEGRETLAEALAGARAVISVVTADAALAAATDAGTSIEPGALYLDLNSVAPETKRAASARIEAAGAAYVDVAVMAPVHPARLAVPLLVSGPHAGAGADALAGAGFSAVRQVGAELGRASAIKMIRSVMVKGLEALTAECVLAAHAAGVTEEVLASLGDGWFEKADYNLDRMMVHGVRRAAEMEEVVKTLNALGVAPLMSAPCAVRQRRIGALAGAAPPPASLPAKLEALEALLKDTPR